MSKINILRLHHPDFQQQTAESRWSLTTVVTDTMTSSMHKQSECGCEHGTTMNGRTTSIGEQILARSRHETNSIIDQIFVDREWFDLMLEDDYTFILLGTEITQLVYGDTDMVSRDNGAIL